MKPDVSPALARVLEVLDRLLDPEKGCPWDLKQTPLSIRLYILEETYELLEAIENNDLAGIQEEMGDCLFLMGFLAKLFPEISLKQVLDHAADKMISRHPHIFGEIAPLEDSEAVRQQWHELKRQEKKRSVVGGVPGNLPALLRTHRLTERAGRVGFDWASPTEVIKTIRDELGELEEAMEAGDAEQSKAELGDLLFTAANLGRHLNISAEDALKTANSRFIKRFQFIEEKLAEKGLTPDQADLTEMDRLWEMAKQELE